MKYTECYDCGDSCQDTGKMSLCDKCEAKLPKPECICHLVGRDLCLAHEK